MYLIPMIPIIRAANSAGKTMILDSTSGKISDKIAVQISAKTIILSIKNHFLSNTFCVNDTILVARAIIYDFSKIGYWKTFFGSTRSYKQNTYH